MPFSTQGRVVQNLVNAYPGLKVDQKSNFSCVKMCLTAYVLISLRLLYLRAEGQTIETLTGLNPNPKPIEKLQN